MKTVTIRANDESLEKLYKLLKELPDVQIIESDFVSEESSTYLSESLIDNRSDKTNSHNTVEIKQIIDGYLLKEITNARHELNLNEGTDHTVFIAELRSRYQQ